MKPQFVGYKAAEAVVLGARKRSKSKSRSRRWAEKISHNDQGKAVSLSAGVKRARASFQKAPCRNSRSQKARHRSTVRQCAPVISRKPATRATLKPWRIAAKSNTTNPT